MKLVELKIKSKSLAAEAKIIRSEENKLENRIADLSDLQKSTEQLQFTRQSLHNHRVLDVRYAARATYLARAYLKNKPYKSVELGRRKDMEVIYNSEIVPSVVKMVYKYGGKPVSPDELKNWSKLD